MRGAAARGCAPSRTRGGRAPRAAPARLVERQGHHAALRDHDYRAAAAAALPTFVGINQICVLQALLATVGALPGSRAVDGRYDRQTRDALKSFQVQNALVSNGLLTPETMNSLTEAALERMFDTTGAAEVTAAQAVPEAAPATPEQSEEKTV